MYISPDFDSKPTALKNRIKLEQRIVKLTVDTLLKDGYSLAVFDGEETTAITTDKKTLIDALMETDEDYLFVYEAGVKARFGWVRFVYGNDGYDVINDYTTNLDEALAGVNAYAESQDRRVLPVCPVISGTDESKPEA
jgi:hypothetical protein